MNREQLIKDHGPGFVMVYDEAWDSCEFFLDGHSIISCSYDEDGSAVVDFVGAAMKEVANKLGIPYKEVYP